VPAAAGSPFDNPAKSKPGRQPSNLYVRCGAIESDQFLDLVDGRDMPLFQAQFACWLAGVALHHSRCTVDLVQRCLDAEPRKLRERLRAKLPKNLQRLPKARRERLQAEFARAVRVNGRRHRTVLVKKLARLPCAAQVVELNQLLDRLWRFKLVPRPRRLSRAAERRALAGVPEDSRLGLNRVTRANLFVLGSAESGSGKTETFREVAAPFIDHQANRLEEWKQTIAPRLNAF
jgi:hypothetical protein